MGGYRPLVGLPTRAIDFCLMHISGFIHRLYHALAQSCDAQDDAVVSLTQQVASIKSENY